MKRCEMCGTELGPRQQKFCGNKCYGLSVIGVNQEKAGTQARNREIIALRNNTHPTPTFQAIGDLYGISKQRVSQICNRYKTNH